MQRDEQLQVTELGFGEVVAGIVDALGQRGEHASTPCGEPLSAGSAQPSPTSERRVYKSNT